MKIFNWLKRNKGMLLLCLIGIALLVVWSAAPFIVQWLLPKSFDVKSGTEALSNAGQFGDLYGSINALFSGFALVGVIAAIWLQSKELRLQRQELVNQREEIALNREEMKQSNREAAKSADALTKQLSLSATSAMLQALPFLINGQRERVHVMLGWMGIEKDISAISQDFVRTQMKEVGEEIEMYLKTIKEDEAMRGKNEDDVTEDEEDIDCYVNWVKGKVRALETSLRDLNLLDGYFRDMDSLYSEMRNNVNY